MKHLLVDGRAACTPSGDVRAWNADAILTPDPAEVDCQRCIMKPQPVAPGSPAAGHISASGFWHPGPVEGCPKCEEES